MNTTQHNFEVQGMSCQHCVRAIEEAVQTLDSQAAVRVDLSTGHVEIQSQQAREALAGSIAEAGYRIKA